jgi:hypothetical protein
MLHRRRCKAHGGAKPRLWIESLNLEIPRMSIHPAALMLSLLFVLGAALAFTQATLIPCTNYDATKAAELLLTGWALTAATMITISLAAVWPLLARREARLRHQERVRARGKRA